MKLRNPLIVLFASLIFLLPSGAQAESKSAQATLDWEELPSLPNETGLAGVFSGVHHDVLLVAGGANFDQGLPWEKQADGSTPPKVYHADIYALIKSEEEYTWAPQTVTLPEAAAYGVSIPTKKGIVCIGGERKDLPVDGAQALHFVQRVFTLSWTNTTQSVVVDESLPDLPFGLSSAAGAVIDKVIYLAGGATEQGVTNAFLALDLNVESPVWVQIPSWPGPARLLPVAAGQSNGNGNDFYLFSGRLPHADNTVDYLSDGYVYRTGTAKWETLLDITVDGAPRCIMAGSAAPVGAHSIGVFGSGDGVIMEEIMALVRKGDASGEIGEIQKTHPGFNRDVLMYNTVLDRWSKVNEFPDMPHVTTTAVKWGNDVVIPSGEISPGVRSPKVWIGSPSNTRKFGALNYGVLIAYLVAIIVNGMWFFASDEIDRRLFLKLVKRIPWWAAGLSIFGTQLSAITFYFDSRDLFTSPIGDALLLRSRLLWPLPWSYLYSFRFTVD